MNLDLKRICELAGLGSTSRGVVSEAVAAVKPPVAGLKPPVAGANPTVTGVKPPVAEYDIGGMFGDDEMDEMDDMDDMDGMDADSMDGMHMEDDVMYEINEEELAEALVHMRQTNLDESYVRDAVREEIARALRNRGASWLYGKNQPTNSKAGQVVQGGFGIGFKNK